MKEISETQVIRNHHIATNFHDAGSKNIVIFCHGYRGSSTGPNRFFVKVARQLAEHSISSLRFDQYGSGNSEGDFYNSSFNDWVATTKDIAKSYLSKQYQVALFGQSMGGATVIAVASELQEITTAVAWVPDAGVEAFQPPPTGFVEEAGQRVQAKYWQEAHDAKIADKLRAVRAPMFIVQCANDEYVSDENHQAIVDNAQPQHQVEMFAGLSHSNWSYEQAETIINKSVEFLVKYLPTNHETL